MKREDWHYLVWNAFSDKVYNKTISSESLLNNGELKFVGDVLRLVQDGDKHYAEDATIGLKCVFAEKNGFKYVVPEKYLEQIPFNVAESFELLLKKSDPTVYRFVTKINSVKISPEKFWPLKEFIDLWNPQDHTSPQDWRFIKLCMVASLHKGVKIRLCGAPACVDGETEFLSQYGWKKISEYAAGDMVMQYDKNTCESSYVKPIEYIKHKSLGFYHVKNKFLDQMITPNHNVLYESWDGKLLECQATEWVGHHLMNKSGSGRKILTTFKPNIETQMNISDIELRIMVAVIADGTYPHKNKNIPNQVVIRLKKESKKERIIGLLECSTIKYTRTDYDDGYSHIKFVAPMHAREYGSEFWACSYHQLEVIADEVVEWDYCKSTETFSTCSKATADFIQYVFSSMGNMANISVNDRVGQSRGEYIRKSKEYSITRAKLNTTTLSNSWNKTEVPFVQSNDGFQYCFRVPHGFLVLRRNNKVFVTGNCGKNANWSVAKHIVKCISRPPNPTIAKLETEIYYNRVLLPDEMTSLSKAQVRDIETLFLIIGDDSDEYQKHSMAKNKKMNKVDVTELSVIFTYNRKQDLQLGSNFFDEIWTSIDAFKSRYPALMVEGEVTSMIPKMNLKQATKIMERNFEDMRKIAKTLVYYQSHTIDEMHHWDRTKNPFKGRHAVNTDGIFDVLDVYCESQQEFDVWCEWIRDRVERYHKQ